jgi:hypothetical protein
MAFGGYPPPWFSLAGEAKSEKRPLPRSGHGALCLIHLEFESFRNAARYALHHPLSRSFATHVKVAI